MLFVPLLEKMVPVLTFIASSARHPRAGILALAYAPIVFTTFAMGAPIGAVIGNVIGGILTPFYPTALPTLAYSLHPARAWRSTTWPG